MVTALTFYDGVGCIGGNKILLEENGAALLFDFGTNFKAEGMYFDEFLGPRSSFGFADLLSLEILPPLRGLYRPDLEYPGVWERYADHPLYRQVEVLGVLLSHAHFDHCGHISYLRTDIPVVTSLTGAVICKALQDTGGGNRLQEICYATPREFAGGVLKAVSYRNAPFVQRPYFVFGAGGAVPAVGDFWAQCDGSRALACRPLTFCNEEEEYGPFRVRFWPVDHSIPGAGAFGVKTAAGWVIYTGDLRLHGCRGALTRRFMVEAAALRPVVLICEGTHPATTEPVTEEEVCANALAIVRRAKGLVVADFGPRNVERLLSFLRVGAETGRQLVLTLKDVYLLAALHATGEPGVPSPFSDHRLCLFVKPRVTLRGWEKVLVERFAAAAPDRMVGAAAVARAQGNYLLCFSYYDFHALLDINPRGGTYIYSSSEAFDEEMLLDHQRVGNWINHFGFTLYGSLGRDRERSGLHASGHIHGPGLEELIATVRPEIVIPVHTESPDFFRRFMSRCRVIFPERGERVVLS
ncbi:exonuclease [Thermodesulfitimonas sp.]